jgi:hypothetical protein
MVSGGPSNQRQLHSPSETLMPPMNRAQLTDRILERNPTATATFLGAFSESSLAHYLEHLCVADEPSTPWVRKGISPGIVRREAME